jgi:ABC-2 type transport system permease protein
MTWLRVIRYALIVGKTECDEASSVLSWIVGWLPRMAAQSIFYAMIGQLLGSQERVEYLVIGAAMVVGLASIGLTVPQSTWDRSDGVYPLLVAAPVGLLLSIVGRTSIRMMVGVVTCLVAFAGLPLLFGVRLPWPGALALIALVPLTLVSSWFVALFVGSVANLAPSARNLMHNVMTMTTLAFGGVTVPVTYWPDWIQVFANVIPVSHGLMAIRLAIAESDPSLILQHAGLCALIGLAWLAVSVLTVDRMASVGRASGSIEFVG